MSTRPRQNLQCFLNLTDVAKKRVKNKFLFSYRLSWIVWIFASSRETQRVIHKIYETSHARIRLMFEYNKWIESPIHVHEFKSAPHPLTVYNLVYIFFILTGISVRNKAFTCMFSNRVSVYLHTVYQKRKCPKKCTHKLMLYGCGKWILNENHQHGKLSTDAENFMLFLKNQREIFLQKFLLLRQK